jgi:hypothetical protein
LIREWEAKKPFESGTQWSEAEKAKYVVGQDIVAILGGFGITVQLMQSM